jgi:hypothetical protein
VSRIRFVVAISFIVYCVGAHSEERVAPCVIDGSIVLPTTGTAPGAKLSLPKDAKGPYYDSDDRYNSRPTWSGEKWHVHFVYGNGVLTEFMEAKYCSLNDSTMHRRVKIGDYMRYGAVADISRVDSPDKVTSVQVTIEEGGLSESEALSIISSTVTTWEEQ